MNLPLNEHTGSKKTKKPRDESKRYLGAYYTEKPKDFLREELQDQQERFCRENEDMQSVCYE